MFKSIQKEKETQILFLDENEKKIQENKTGTALAALFLYAVFVMLSCSGILIYGSVFPLDGAYSSYFIAIAAAALVLFLLYSHGKLKWKAHLITAGIMLVWLLIFRKSIYAGGLKQLNAIFREIWAYYGVYMPVLSADGIEKSSWMAVMFLMSLFFWWSAVGFFYRKQIVWTLLPPLLLCVLELMVGNSPGFSAVFLLFTGAAGALPYCTGRKMEGNWKLQAVKLKSGALLLIVMLCSLTAAAVFGNGRAAALVRKHDMAMGYQIYAEEWLKNALDFGFFQRENGEISNRRPDYDDVAVMNVTLDTDTEPEGVYYLRGYVGDTYQGGTWVNTGARTFESYTDENGNGFDSKSGKYVLNFLFGYEAGNSRRSAETMQIEYLEARDSYAYLPYGMNVFSVKGEDSQAQITVSGDSMVLRKDADTLTVTGYFTGTHFGYGRVLGAYRGSVADGDTSPELMETYRSFAECYLEVPAGLKQINALGEELNSELENNLKTYGYAVAVTLEDGTVEVSTYSRSELAAQLVREEIAQRVSYSLKLDAVPPGEDVTQYFLFGSQKGFCQHYASAGTLLLRKLGVPARYVTGYAVSAEDFEQQPDGAYAAVVKDSDAHAWVEYYEEGVGWVPVDMTEGANAFWDRGNLFNRSEQNADEGSKESGQSGNQPENGDSEEKNQPEEKTQNPENGQEERDDSSENSGQTSQDGSEKVKDETQNQIKDGKISIILKNDGILSGFGNGGESVRIFGMMAVILLLIVCFAGGAAGIFCYGNQKLSREFYQKNNRKAVKSISYHVYRLLLRKGKVKSRYLDDRGYRKAVSEITETITKEEWERYFRILQLAYYSNEEPAKEDAVFCRSIYLRVKRL